MIVVVDGVSIHEQTLFTIEFACKQTLDRIDPRCSVEVIVVVDFGVVVGLVVALRVVDGLVVLVDLAAFRLNMAEGEVIVMIVIATCKELYQYPHAQHIGYPVNAHRI